MLRSVARQHMKRERQSALLQTTALANECFLRLRGVQIDDSGHFRALAHNAARRTLIDHANSEATKKRGGRRQRIPLAQISPTIEQELELELDLAQLLTRLHKEFPKLHFVIHNRFFAGHSFRQVAAMLGCSEATVRNRERAGLMTLLSWFED